MIDFRNLNTIWTSILVETLHCLGLKTAILCPGSRSGPLTVAFAQHPEIESIPILDERSAAFFALGTARKSGLPTVLVCTSGTAGANFYPAVIEAKESCIPLIILTADRPPELRNCHAGQTVDQVKLYGHYPNWQMELRLPAIEFKALSYLRQMIIYSWERSLIPIPGVVHLNLPFDIPLDPISKLEANALENQFPTDFFITVKQGKNIRSVLDLEPPLTSYLSHWQSYDRGILIAGVAQPNCPQVYAQAVMQLARFLNWPILAEGLSPVRNYHHLYEPIISTYDLILRNPQLAESLSPQVVIQVGELPTSKLLRTWLEETAVETFILDSTYQNLDPLHRPTLHLRISIEQLLEVLLSENFLTSDPAKPSTYLNQWLNVEIQARALINEGMKTLDELIEPKVSWLLPQVLPMKTPIFISNSMPVRDVEFFWQPNSSQIQPFFNRGANGIDGTLSTALGIAHRNQSSVLLTGDLALLHDINGFLFHNQLRGHLTILLINNQGGGIFEMLPIARFDPPFEKFFATPQAINFAQLCTAYPVAYQMISSWSELERALSPLPQSGIRVLEICTNRKSDALWRLQLFNRFSVEDLNLGL
ncbi:MAG: 2-succinyl-5-enolpyruvyl-6-hydroxy-3-cyclohexene-1-carboxylic-acid synthase [Microcoleaceae cyanobacterium]